jgi:tubulin monoglycylase TTLL15
MNYDANFAVHAFDENSLLIDGHRFYFGVFFLVTSVEPLRIYRYKGDVMARFARESQKRGKFLCQESSGRLEIPSLERYSEYSTKHAMEEHLRGIGINLEEIFKKVDEKIVKFLVERFKNVEKDSNNLFQIFRADFNFYNDKTVEIFDFELFIDYEGNESLIYETLRLTGALSPYEFKCR